MLLITCLIDLKTPMSTDQNFIVLLPATILLVLDGLCSLFAAGINNELPMARSVSLVISITLASLLLVSSYRSVSAKISPRQNWKALAEYVRDSGICATGKCYVMGSYGLHKFYFNGSGFEGLKDLALPPGKDSPAPSLEEQIKVALRDPDVPVLGFHRVGNVALPELTSSERDVVCLQPPQGGSYSTFIVLRKIRVHDAKGLNQMIPCR